MGSRQRVTPLRVLVGCEFTGTVRRAFAARGHTAYSCDLSPSEDNSPFHIQMDIFELLEATRGEWDLFICHWPCTFLCHSGVRWFTTIPDDPDPFTLYGRPRWEAMERHALKFRKLLFRSGISRVCLENPVMHGHGKERVGVGWTQSVQPWQFGHREIKRTCFWLVNLPKLKPTKVVGPPVGHIQKMLWAKVHRARPGPERAMDRSRTYPGIAKAMAEQWGSL